MSADQPPLAPKTTAQEDLTTAGQRRVNIIWETTQATIAIMVVLSNIVVGVYQGISTNHDVQFPAVLSNTLFLVVGFYFSRTNHAAIGGIGPKPNGDNQRYLGR